MRVCGGCRGRKCVLLVGIEGSQRGHGADRERDARPTRPAPSARPRPDRCCAGRCSWRELAPRWRRPSLSRRSEGETTPRDANTTTKSESRATRRGCANLRTRPRCQHRKALSTSARWRSARRSSTPGGVKGGLSGIAAEYAGRKSTDDLLASPLRTATLPRSRTSRPSPRSLTRRAAPALQLGALIREQADGGAVVVCIEKIAALVLSMCAALASGCTFLLWASLPTARAAHMITEVGVRLALHAAAARRTRRRRRAGAGRRRRRAHRRRRPVPPPLEPLPPASLAYVCYTSGSTELPKGDGRPRCSATRGPTRRRTVVRGARVLLAAGVAFDPSIGEAWTALVAGATLLLPRRAEAKEQLGPLLARSNAARVRRRPRCGRWSTRRRSCPRCAACLGGEAMAPALIRRWAAAAAPQHLRRHRVHRVPGLTPRARRREL